MQYTLHEIIWIFYVYSFLGWCAGTVANALRRKRFVNTGFLNLPFCPVYGITAVVYAIFLPELKNHVFFLFLGGCILAFAIIVITSVLLERVFNRKWWDYSKTRFQFQGYLNFVHLLIFGVAAVLCIRAANPLALYVYHTLPGNVGWIVLLALGALTAADTICCCAAVLQLKQTVNMARFMDYVQDFTDDFGNALTGKIQKRMVKAFPNIQGQYIFQTPAREKQPDVFARGCCFYKLTGLFFLGAFLGDITETIFCRVTAGVWMSRSSVVYGPFSIVWGLGCTFLTAFLYKYREKSDSCVFLYGTVLGGAYEYVCSVFTELVFGTVFWDYSSIPFNLGGRINLLYCFFWGIAAVVWLKVLYPLFSGWIEKLPVKAGKLLMQAAIVFMVINMAISGMALWRYSERGTRPKAENQLEAFLDQRFPDSRMKRIYPNAKIVE